MLSARRSGILARIGRASRDRHHLIGAEGRIIVLNSHNAARLKNTAIDAEFHSRQPSAHCKAAMWDWLKPVTAAFKIGLSTLALVLAVAASISTPEALAQASDGHTVLAAGDIKWTPAPPSLPAGAQAAVLYGDPGKDGLFALRLKLPKGYAIAPHTHPKPEIVTVISGTFRLGMGEKAEPSKGRPLAAGSFFALHPGMTHFAFADEDTVIQLNSAGPWTLTYVNPNDDPRKKTQ
jgi:quercetin dioxygenase-like cupin family protein